jgi:hypothetical protein
MAERLSPPRWRRRSAVLLLVLLVTALHGWVTAQFEEDRLGWGNADRLPKRIEVSFVHEMELVAPPAVAPAPPAPPLPKPKARTAARAASAPEPEPEPEPKVEPPERVASAPALELPASAAVAAASPASAPASAPSAPPFEWPPSTELAYDLTGNYRGPVNGTARVRWIRAGTHYQVHLDVFIGLESAPLMSRRMTSDGELTEQGLSPRRYDEVTKVGFGEPRVATVRFEPSQIVLANGGTHEQLPGVQDTASQFVQLTWLFTVHPERLRTGQAIELPLALPRRVDRWVYDVLEPETLYTPFGELEVFHVKPRRLLRPTNELSVEAWFAPSLQYLPARLRIQQSAEVYVDLMLQRKPRQAAEAPPAASRPYSPPRPTIGDL